jgi:hypothetical protein
MSAFLVEDRTINTIVNWLAREIDHLSLIPYKLRRLGIEPSVPGWEEKLGEAMFQLNIAAVEDRYGKGEASKFRTLAYRYQQTSPVPLVQVLKSLQCWLYQCCEGGEPATLLYTLFDTDVRVYLMSKIITMLPEYEEAYWG